MVQSTEQTFHDTWVTWLFRFLLQPLLLFPSSSLAQNVTISAPEFDSKAFAVLLADPSPVGFEKRIRGGDIMKQRIMLAFFLFVCLADACFAQTNVLDQNPATQLTPQGDVIVGRIDGIPVYQMGQTFIYAVSPDFEKDFSTQEGNTFPRVKIQPKKSWELKENRMGTSAPRVPRSLRMDFQPYQWFHLIDGDLNTDWCSHALNFPDQEEAWLRIDIPVPTLLKEIRIVGRKDGLGGIPGELTIKLSSDLRTWATVYHTVNQLPPGPGGTLHFPLNYSDPVRAIWILGNRMSRVTPYLNPREQFAFSVAEVEAIDGNGTNVALLSRGAGATVSSTYYGDMLTAEEHDLYWPVHFDLGDKWVRVNYWESVFQWCYVEPNEKGEYYIDPRADQAITDTVKSGANIIMALDYGNWLYDVKSSRRNYTVRDWVESHADRLASLPTASPETLQGFLNYTRFIVRHFRDRVKYFEIWNEPNINPPPHQRRMGRIL